MGSELESYDSPPGAERRHVILLEDLGVRVEEMKNSGAFSKQYNTLNTTGPLKPCVYAAKAENREKNRYSDLLPYDDNRVTLQKLKSDPHSDYINASYVDSYRQEKAYICTQGPLENTIGDFWRMIWQENAYIIVMTANLIENGSKKCENYWPDKSEKYSSIRVSLQKEDVFSDYTVRTFKVKKSGDMRQVRQYQFTAWPDHGVPSYSLSVVFFLQDFQNYQKQQRQFSPVVLHCSAGVGRTGSLMAIANAIEMAADTGKVDVLGILYKLRQQRVNAIETVEQFTLVYDTLVDFLLGDVPKRQSEELVLYFNSLRQIDHGTKKSGLERQFERLRLLTDSPRKELCPLLLEPSDKAKEAIPSITPAPENNKNKSSATSLNAVYVSDFGKIDQFVVVDYPSQEKASDFWQMVYDQKCSAIVVMDEFKKSAGSGPTFWPRSGSSFVGTFKLENLSVEAEYFNDLLVRKLKVNNTAVSGKKLVVKMFHFCGWRGDIPPQPEIMICLINRVHLWREKAGLNLPIILTCQYGSNTCGYYCASSHLSSQVKCSDHVDVFEAIRTVRRAQATFVQTAEQYRWLYETACCLISCKKFK